MRDLTCCSVCTKPLDGIGMRTCVVNRVRYHAYCYITVCASGAKGE